MRGQMSIDAASGSMRQMRSVLTFRWHHSRGGGAITYLTWRTSLMQRAARTEECLYTEDSLPVSISQRNVVFKCHMFPENNWIYTTTYCSEASNQSWVVYWRYTELFNTWHLLIVSRFNCAPQRGSDWKWKSRCVCPSGRVQYRNVPSLWADIETGEELVQCSVFRKVRSSRFLINRIFPEYSVRKN